MKDKLKQDLEKLGCNEDHLNYLNLQIEKIKWSKQMKIRFEKTGKGEKFRIQTHSLNKASEFLKYCKERKVISLSAKIEGITPNMRFKDDDLKNLISLMEPQEYHFKKMRKVSLEDKLHKSRCRSAFDMFNELSSWSLDDGSKLNNTQCYSIIRDILIEGDIVDESKYLLSKLTVESVRKLVEYWPKHFEKITKSNS